MGCLGRHFYIISIYRHNHDATVPLEFIKPKFSILNLGILIHIHK